MQARRNCRPGSMDLAGVARPSCVPIGRRNVASHALPGDGARYCRRGFLPGDGLASACSSPSGCAGTCQLSRVHWSDFWRWFGRFTAFRLYCLHLAGCRHLGVGRLCSGCIVAIVASCRQVFALALPTDIWLSDRIGNIRAIAAGGGLLPTRAQYGSVKNG